ncbi:glycosyltransferase family 1 protein, partial [bacterium]|nr:glycosyltransferase family 1 protein [bacterium]
MLLSRRHRALYAAFDRFPTRKGASTHIARFAPALFEEFGGGLLYVVGDETLPAHQVEGEVEIVRFSRPVPNLLERAVAFGEHLVRLLEEADDDLEICHFRDPWSGVPILERPHG